MKVVPKELFTSVRIEGAEYIIGEHWFFGHRWVGILVYCLNLPRCPLHTYQDGARRGGPAHMSLLHRGFTTLGLGVHHLCTHGGNDLWELNVAGPRLVRWREGLHECSTSMSKQRVELSSPVSDSCMETTMFLLLFFQANKQKPSKACSNNLTLLPLRLMPKLVVFANGLWKTWSAARDCWGLALCIFPIHSQLLTIPLSLAQEEPRINTLSILNLQVNAHY